MFGNNAFGALDMDQTPGAGPSRTQIEGPESDVNWLRLVKTNHDVNVKVSEKVSLDDLPQECNLLVVANKQDLLVVGGNSDVTIHKLSTFHKVLEDAAKDASPASEPLATLSVPARPIWIRSAMDDERLVVALENGQGVLVYRYADINNGITSPYHTFSSDIPVHLLDVMPNPCPATSDPLSHLVALVSQDNISILDVEGKHMATPIHGQFTCASWSPKGKQLVLGLPDGKLAQYTPSGTIKAEVAAPPELEEGFHATFIQWIENDIFLVGYANPSGELDDPLDIYIIQRQKEALTYVKFFDPNDAMGNEGRSSAFRHFAILKSWNEKTKYLGFITSGRSSEIALLHCQATPGDNGLPTWEVLMLEETARGVLPASKPGVTDDTSVIGLDLDLTSDKAVKQGIVGGEELPDLPPPPRLLAYSQEGFIVSFNVQYTEAGPYPAMVTPLPSTETAQEGVDTQMESGVQTPAAAPEPTKPPSAFSGFGASTGTSAFGATSTPQKPTAFGTSAFGSSAFGSAPHTTSAFGASAFGQSTTPSSSPFGTSAKPPAFGASSFGQTARPSDAVSQPSAFGQSTFSKASGSSTATPKSQTSAFGQTTTNTSTTSTASPSAIGQSGSGQGSSSAFGQSSKPSAFGSTAFGSSTTSSAFGQSAFGQSSKPSSSSSAFGQSSSPSTSSASAFGQPAKPAAAASSKTRPSAFGAPSSSPSSGFGAFSASKSPSSGFGGFGTSAFGQSNKPPPDPSNTTPRSSPFGGGGTSSAFGSSSAFGNSAFGAKTGDTPKSTGFAGLGPKSTGSAPAFAGFGGFGTKKEEPRPAIEEIADISDDKEPGDGDFGLGGFASALEPAKTVPGLEDSPPASPGQIGNRPSVLDDDSPPPSPPKPAAPQAKAPTSASSAFIKPATAFGGSTSSGFGAFGSQNKPSSTSAFGTTSQGASSAFATPSTPSTSAAPSAFGSSSFGKTSTMGTAFGHSAFGQPSKPSGFGQTSIPSSSPGFGNITGGFGGFAAKSSGNAASPGQQSTSSTGFGGFAAANKPASGSAFGSAFGQTKSNSAFSSLLSGDTTSKVAEKPKQPDSKSTTEKPTETSLNTSIPDSPTSLASKSPTNSPVPQSAPLPPGYDVSSTPAQPKTLVAEAAPQPPGYAVPGITESAKEPSESRTTSSSEAQAVPLPPAKDETSDLVEDTDHTARSLPTSVAVAGGKALPVDEEADQEDAEWEEDEDEYEYDEEEYEEEYEDEDAEYEDEEDEDDFDRERRRSSSIAPDMPSIEEEASGEEIEGSEASESADEQNLQAETEIPEIKTAKSPPPWFAKSPAAEPGLHAPAPVSTDSSSLLSRLGPPPAQPTFDPVQPPAAKTLPVGFSLKHAARTSSPLGTQPPQNSGSNEEKQREAAPFSFFGQTGAALPKVPTIGQASSGGSAFGLGRPSTVSSPAAVSPQDQTAPPFAGFGSPAQTSSVSSSVPIPAARPIPSTFTVPQRQSTPVVAEDPPAKGKSLADVLARMLSGVDKDIQSLRGSLDADAEFHQQLQIPGFNTVSLENLDKHSAIPISSLSDIESMISILLEKVDPLQSQEKDARSKLAEVQRGLLRLDMKVSHVEMVAHSQKDEISSGNEGLSQNQKLKKEQIQSALKYVEDQISSLEIRLDKLNADPADLAESLHPVESDMLERFQNSIKELDATIQDRAETLDELAERISSIRLTTPQRHERENRAMSTTPSGKTPMGVRKRESTPVPAMAIPIGYRPSPEMLQRREASKVAREKLRAKLANLSEAKVTRLDMSQKAKTASSNGPIMIDQLPLPGEAIPEPPASPKASIAVKQEREDESETFGGFSGLGGSFGNIKLDLNAGPTAVPASSSTTRSTRAGGTHRTHTSAVKFNPSSSSASGPGTADNASSLFSGFSFTPPPASNAFEEKGKPQGFFSFSGFGNDDQENK